MRSQCSHSWRCYVCKIWDLSVHICDDVTCVKYEIPVFTFWRCDWCVNTRSCEIQVFTFVFTFVTISCFVKHEILFCTFVTMFCFVKHEILILHICDDVLFCKTRDPSRHICDEQRHFFYLHDFCQGKNQTNMDSSIQTIFFSGLQTVVLKNDYYSFSKYNLNFPLFSTCPKIYSSAKETPHLTTSKITSSRQCSY
jgi:hypothetical protein